MADAEKELSLAEQAEALEERFVLQELGLFEKLKKAVASKSVSNVRAVINELATFENSLSTAHQNVFSHIASLSQAMPDQAKALKTTEAQIQEKVDSVFKIVSAQGHLSQLANMSALNFEAITSAINSAEISLSAWIGLIKKLQEEFHLAETQEKNGSRTFRMLIGDDSFERKRNAEDTFYLMLIEMRKVTGLPMSEGNFEDDKTYVVTEFPVKGFDRAEIRVVSSVPDIIREASGKYDWIATDMNYGEGYRTGGKDVLKNPAIRQNPAIKAIFTSEDDPSVLKELTQMGAIVISPTLMKSREDKVTLLGRAIAEYYSRNNP